MRLLARLDLFDWEVLSGYQRCNQKRACVKYGESIHFTDTSITSRPGLLPIDTGDIDIKEAFHFLQDKVEPVGDLRHAFQQNLMEGILHIPAFFF